MLHYGAGACRDSSCDIAAISTSSLMPLRLRFEQRRVWSSVCKITFALLPYFFFFNRNSFWKTISSRAAVALALCPARASHLQRLFTRNFLPTCLFPASPVLQCPRRSAKLQCPRPPHTRLRLVRGTPRGLSVRPSVAVLLARPLSAFSLRHSEHPAAEMQQERCSCGHPVAGWLFCSFVFWFLQLEATSSPSHWPGARAG